jgi:PAS domain S-box-containing protein
MVSPEDRSRLKKPVGLVYKANRSGCRLIGYTPDEIPKRPIFGINSEITPDCRNRIWTNSEEVTWKRVFSEHRKKDGSIISIDISRPFIRSGGRKYFCSICP